MENLRKKNQTEILEGNPRWQLETCLFEVKHQEELKV
jgi:hypothetical protein